MKLSFKKTTLSALIVILIFSIFSSALLINRYVSNKGDSTLSAAASTSVSVKGNQLVNGSGQTVRLIGVDLAGQFECTKHKNPELYYVPIDQSFVTTLSTWHVNAIRMSLDEDCWLGINGTDPTTSGAAYQNFVENTVSLMNSAGIEVILTLTGVAPGTYIADATIGHLPLPDADHAPDFWTSVASTFKGNPGVIFDAYNEPQQVSWSCWLDGCTLSNPYDPGTTYQAVGMQKIVNTIRKTGATNVIMLGGTDWATDLSGWLQNEPVDPDNQLAASFHSYKATSCNDAACWNSTIAPIMATTPVISGEMGETDCSDDYINSYMSWADSHNESYLAWGWDIPTVCTDPSLISSFDGTPSPSYGIGYQSHLASLYSEGEIPNLVTVTTPPPPTSNINTPLNDASVHGNSLPINVSASPGDGNSIASVELLVDGNIVQTLTNAPYNFSINTLNYSDGIHTLKVVVTDNQGQTTDQSISIYITNGDINGDGIVNISDLSILAANWGNANATYAQGDINGDGIVNISDLSILAANWGYVNP